MTRVSSAQLSSSERARPLARVIVGTAIVLVVLYAYALRAAVGDLNPFDFFGYFTNQTSSLTALVLIAVGILALGGRPRPTWLSVAWGVGAACLIVVAVVYNTLVPGTGSAPPWVSVVLHIVFPAVVLFDVLLSPDRPRLSWRQLWWVLPYPLVWITVVLVRGVTDGWVPYGFLLPQRGIESLILHVIGILALLILAAAAVWGFGGRAPRRSGV
ncbi:MULTISPECIES: Pr6Pr family membrane protein [Microbacterium]|uniref:Pr6Pr family membrane protein n=1 Tax=Microbacterium TaxID=33882 RepID=UPI002785313A|nr:MULTISPECIES: Pr6Pr family membrane protein [Microbacterium]MDQ1082064.1 hypothetical protein [Microbacterium sp. SORGH_AS_0344]MDQ1169169.1 hypothetical protein [Microbacterium proteolyticum]